MKDYYLSDYDILKICVFNGIGNHYGFIRQPINTQASFIQQRIFDPILNRNPSYSNLFKTFIEDYKNITNDTKNNNFFSFFKERLSNKILAQDAVEPIFSSSYVYKEDSDRTKFLKHIFEEHPKFILDVHDFINSKSKTGNPFDLSDCIYDAYFQMLKSKSATEFKKQIPKSELINNINLYKTEKTTHLKKKLNAYITNFPKDVETFELIFKNLKEEIERNGSLKIYWEDKLKSFPKDIQNKYYQTEKELPWGKDYSAYFYYFQINPEFIIEKTRVSNSQSNYIKSNIQNSLSSFLMDHFNGEHINANGGSYNAITMLFKTELDKNRANRFTDLVKDNLDLILNTYFKKDNQNYHSTSELLKEYFTKLNLAFELDKKLDSKEENTKSFKRKI